MAEREGPEGIGGWLTFFLVTLGIITPAVTIFMTVSSFTDPEAAFLPPELFRSLMTADIISAVLVVALCWFAAWRFLRVFNWTTVRIGVGTLWALAVTNALVLPLVVSLLTGLSLSLVFQSAEPQMFIRPVIYAGIWTAYLLLSKRVRNTYGRVSDTEAAEVFA